MDAISPAVEPKPPAASQASEASSQGSQLEEITPAAPDDWAPKKVVERIDDVLNLLKDEAVSEIILVGDAGIGKTWMAREISKSAITKGPCYASLWISMNMKHDTASLYKNIACQLSLPSSIDEELEEDVIGKEKEDEIQKEKKEDIDKKKEQELKALKEKISEKLDLRRKDVKRRPEAGNSSKANKFLLLVLDDERPETNEHMSWSGLREMFGEGHSKLVKLLITRRNSVDSQTTLNSTRKIEVPPLLESESLDLLKERVENIISDSEKFKELSHAIAKSSMGLPAVIILIAEALNHFGKCGSWWTYLESVLDEVGDDKESGEASLLLQCVYDMLPRGTVTNCFWHCREFFQRYGGVHYNELIAHWIIEGYFDTFNGVEKAYEEAHRVLIELMDRGIIKIQEDNIIVLEGITRSFTDFRHGGVGGFASLGLTSVVDNGTGIGLGSIAPTDGMIKTLSTDREWEKVSTLLVDGGRLSREVPEEFFKRAKSLKVLALFDTRFKSLPPTLSQLENLLVLALRGCDLLNEINCVSDLKKLTVLEISGASSLREIPYDLFEQLTQLQSINLSGSLVNHLPDNLPKLTRLRWLILRSCSRLITLPKIKALEHLEVLDLSGSTSFQKFQDKRFTMLHKLKFLDLSKTKLKIMPILSDLKELRCIFLRGCTDLSRLPSLERLPSLKILDLSGAAKMKEINKDSLKSNCNLKILDLSKTAFNHLPSNISNLFELSLSGCDQLKDLPYAENFPDDLKASSLCQGESSANKNLLRCIDLSETKVKNCPSLSNFHNLHRLLLKSCQCLEKLPEVEELKSLKELDLSGCDHVRKLPPLDALCKLEVLDLSGCTALPAIPDQSFEHMSCLQKLKLSGTNIESLSTLSSKSLCELVLRNCTELKVLPPQEVLSNLKVLDLCGAISIDIKPECLEQMTNLQNLNLSQKELKQFSFLSKLTKLQQLSLNGCSGLSELPSLEALGGLEVLDLSETEVSSLSLGEKLDSLRELLLRDCSKLVKLPSLKAVTNLEVLDLSGSGVKEFPYEISELFHLKRLDLSKLEIIEKVDWGKIQRLPEELNWGKFKISDPFEIVPDIKHSILAYGTKIFEILKENPKLREMCFDRCLLRVCYPNKETKECKVHCPMDEVIFNDTFFSIRQFLNQEAPNRFIELHGFKEFPTGLEHVLECVEYISLVETEFMEFLSNLGSDASKLKGCWLEGCTKMKNIFIEAVDVKLGENLESLWVSNLCNLKSLCSEKLESVNFMELQELHLDCCPMLEDVFPSMVKVEKLKVLRIKFCEKLKTIFRSHGSVKCELQNLQELYLFKLPELTTIGAILPPETQVHGKACPYLNVEEFSEAQRQSVENIISELE